MVDGVEGDIKRPGGEGWGGEDGEGLTPSYSVVKIYSTT
jgi:hypothetical protein